MRVILAHVKTAEVTLFAIVAGVCIQVIELCDRVWNVQFTVITGEAVVSV